MQEGAGWKRSLGIHFAPDNHVVPVYRWGLYDRCEGPGIFWIHPLFERIGNPIYIGIRKEELTFKQALTKDSIPFTISLSLLYRFDPTPLPPEVASALIERPESASDALLGNVEHCLRDLIRGYTAEQLCNGSAAARLAKHLWFALEGRLQKVGIYLEEEGILLREIVPPAEYIRAVLDARRYHILDEALGSWAQGRTDTAPNAEIISVLSRLGTGISPFLLFKVLAQSWQPFPSNDGEGPQRKVG